MPNLPISQLPDISGSTLGFLSTDAEFAVAQAGVTYKVKTSNISEGFAGGSFYHATTQSGFSANVAYSMSADTQLNGNGVSVVDGSKFTVSATGQYNLAFSAQLDKTQGGTAALFDVWFAKNGTNIPYSNTRITLANNNTLVVASWNIVEDLNAGDYLEIKHSCNTTNVILYAEDATGTPTRPQIPSVIVTIFQV